MDIKIEFSNELGMFVAIVDGTTVMKNKKQSTLYKKMAIWLLSQGL